MNIALILAGGVGTRAKELIPKQFVKVANKPVIIYTLEKFQSCSMIDKIYISCVSGWEDTLSRYISEFKINKVSGICRGGSTGLESVAYGLNAIGDAATDNDLLLIHDSVRPFIDTESIERNLEVAKEYGNALTAVDLVEDLVLSENGVSSRQIVSREKLKRVMTPQTFRYGLLKEVYSSTDIYNTSAPSTFLLCIQQNIPVYCSRGSDKNIKLTYPEDIEYFRKMFE